MDIHLHINVGNESHNQQNQQKQLSIVERIKHCYDWKSLYTLETEFNKVGLHLMETSGGRKILCRVENNKPVIEQIVDDYIFVGSQTQLDEEISKRALEVVIFFVEHHAGTAVSIGNNNQNYSNDLAMYGKYLPIHESKTGMLRDTINQEMAVLGKLINE